MRVYLVDCFYSDATGIDGFRVETFHIKAPDDNGGIREATTHASSKAPHHFHVRLGTKKGYSTIYRSENA